MSAEVVKVIPEHINIGIQKYRGVVDLQLSSLIKEAKLNYVPYRFQDGRILLVLPNNIGGFLYQDKEALFRILNLTG